MKVACTDLTLAIHRCVLLMLEVTDRGPNTDRDFSFPLEEVLVNRLFLALCCNVNTTIKSKAYCLM